MKIAILGPTLAAAATLALLFGTTGLAANPPSSPTPAAAEDKLQSEFLFDLVLEAQMPSNLATANGGRLIVPISGGTFTGPRLKGTIVLPSGDWVVQRPDGSRRSRGLSSRFRQNRLPRLSHAVTANPSR